MVGFSVSPRHKTASITFTFILLLLVTKTDLILLAQTESAGLWNLAAQLGLHSREEPKTADQTRNLTSLKSSLRIFPDHTDKAAGNSKTEQVYSSRSFNIYRLAANGQFAALEPAPSVLAASRVLTVVRQIHDGHLIFGNNDQFPANNASTDRGTRQLSPNVTFIEKTSNQPGIHGHTARPAANNSAAELIHLVLNHSKRFLLDDNSASTSPNNILQVGPGRTYKKPSEAAAVARDGDTIVIDAGEYLGDVAVWTQNDLKISGVGGRAHLIANGAHAQGKGTWVVKGNNTIIENIEFSGAVVPDHNGAAIRQEGCTLTIRNCFFHDNETGILTDDDPQSEILIEYSEFARNSYSDGHSHNMYINRIRRFTLRYSYSHHAKIGHNLKSRAQENHILYSRIMDEQAGTSSYAIDLPNGGLAYIIGNLIQQGPQTENSTIVAYGAEGLSHLQNEFYLVNNTLVNDRNGGIFVSVKPGASYAKLINNLFVGAGTVLSGVGEQITNQTTSSPGFVNRDIFDYRLTDASHAIDAGSIPGVAHGVDLMPAYHYVHPLAVEIRPRDDRVDVGAYEFTTVTSTEKQKRIPENFALEQNYPNPFNPVTIIRFRLPGPGKVYLTIYNTAGQLVRRLIAGPKSSGIHEVLWNGTDDQGRRLPSGVYLCRFQMQNFAVQKKLVLAK